MWSTTEEGDPIDISNEVLEAAQIVYRWMKQGGPRSENIQLNGLQLVKKTENLNHFFIARKCRELRCSTI